MSGLSHLDSAAIWHKKQGDRSHRRAAPDFPAPLATDRRFQHQIWRTKMNSTKEVFQSTCIFCGYTALGVLGAVTAAVLVWVALI